MHLRIGPDGTRVLAPVAPGLVTKVLITSAARQLAEEHQLDITRVEGTGPGGRITEDDVRRYIEGLPVEVPPLEIAPERAIPFAGIGRSLASRPPDGHC